MLLYHLERSDLRVTIRDGGREALAVSRCVDEIPVYKPGSKGIDDFQQVVRSEEEDRTIYVRDKKDQILEERCLKNVKETLIPREESFWKKKEQAP